MRVLTSVLRSMEMRTTPSKETLTVEFKSDRTGLNDTELIDAVVGIANSKGGSLFLGVEDDGTITGVNKKHADPEGVCALIANRTVPSIYTQAEIIHEDGQDILKIDIPMSKVVVASSEGKILKRRLKIDGAPENIPMYPFEINSRLSDLGSLDFSASILPDATPDDFDPNERSRLRNIIRLRKGENQLLELSDEDLDKALQFTRTIEGITYPTITGMLLIGKEDRLSSLIPTARTSFQVLQGTQIRVNEQFSKPLLATFEILENHIKAWNPEKETEYGLIRIPIPEFSEISLREGLVNAFCHRDYSILQMVRIVIDDDGLTINSPGGFIEGVTLDNLLTVEPHGRNPALADAFKRIGLAERTGRGIDRIFEGSMIYGRPLPDYSESTPRNVRLFIQRAEPDLPFMKMLLDEENKTGRTFPTNSLLILSALRTSRRLGLKDIEEATHISRTRLKASLERLVESGLIEGLGSASGREYIISAETYWKQGNPTGYIHQADIETIRSEELLIELARQQDGMIKREDAMALLHVKGDRAYRLLRKLTQKGILRLEGKGKMATYRLVEK